jgi:hypothetical protein
MRRVPAQVVKAKPFVCNAKLGVGFSRPAGDQLVERAGPLELHALLFGQVGVKAVALRLHSEAQRVRAANVCQVISQRESDLSSPVVDVIRRTER